MRRDDHAVFGGDGRDDDRNVRSSHGAGRDKNQK
jgi:hypothetical protein